MQNKEDVLEDRCHMKLYRHPPRMRRQIKMAENSPFILNKTILQNEPLHTDTAEKEKRKNHKTQKSVFSVGLDWIREIEDEEQLYDMRDGYLKALMKEVCKNNYKYDLCLKCNKRDLDIKSNWISRARCPHDVYKENEDTLLSIVNEKMKHYRHKAVDEPLTRDNMLALLLYTGGECNYDLCGSQRKGDYNKWKWFDYCLYGAIEKLSAVETGNYPLYSGLRNVKLNNTKIENAYFVTYVSSSWKKTVAESFMSVNVDGGDVSGMMIEIDPSFRADINILCCDVSWISKFEGEAEVLIARSIGSMNGCSLKVIDDGKYGIQTVSLTRATEGVFRIR